MAMLVDWVSAHGKYEVCAFPNKLGQQTRYYWDINVNIPKAIQATIMKSFCTLLPSTFHDTQQRL